MSGWRLTIVLLLMTQTHSPEYIITDDCRFWIDDSIELSLAILLSYDICSFRVVDPPPTSQHGGSPVDMICIEETADPTACSLPQYIGRLQSYSERDCRAICLQLAKSIKCLHDSGIAHRDLHVENVLVDVFVSNDLTKLLCYFLHVC